MRILVVDDEKDVELLFRQKFRKEIRNKNLELVFAFSGQEALEMLKKEGIDIGFIQIKLLHPFPTEIVKSLLQNAKKVIDIEANHSGQLGKIFKQNITREIDYFILKYTGRGMTSTEIYEALKKIVQNKADKREILKHGA